MENITKEKKYKTLPEPHTHTHTKMTKLITIRLSLKTI